jgi:hypothetical protein
MKLKFVSKLCGSLFVLLLALNSSAQDQGIKTLPSITVTSGTNVTQKVNSAFQKTFKDAQEAKWYKLNKNYLVEFLTKDQKNKALFRKNGYLIYHIAYGHENNLPEDIRKTVKSNYVDYDITSAINVKEDQRDIWVVSLEDKTKLVVVKVEEGALEEVNNLQKTM